jgi:kanamycin kinase
MHRYPIQPDLSQFPQEFHSLLSAARVYDSSCSKEARVYFIDTGRGYFLKSAPAGSLQKEAAMDRFFHKKALGPQVFSYLTAHRDWLLTSRIPGEDCTHAQYTSDPKRLCDLTAQLLRQLHDTPIGGCPIPNRTADYIATAEENFRTGHYDASLFPDNWGYASAEEAIAVVREFAPALKNDTLLHGDYCLPNILLDNWRFTGFIDLGAGGIGDRHIDLFWGVWSLFFNLKTNAWKDRFLDVYGRDRFDPEILKAIAAFEVFG